MYQKNNYENSIIYKLVCLDTDIKEFYIGSTTQWRNRKARHKKNTNNIECKAFVYDFIRKNGGWDNWRMIEIEKYKCENKRELEKREFQLISELKPTLNMRVNLYQIPKKEYLKIYQIKHKDKLKEYHKQYTESNKDKKKEYDRLRYLKKKNEI